VIRLKEGHIIHAVELISKRKYCKWHDSYSHTTNECHYFRRQVQLTLNDGRLTLGDGGKMRLDVDPFLVNTVGFGEKRILVHSDESDTAKGKNVVMSDELQNKMIKPHNPKVGVWKQNVRRSLMRKAKPNSEALITKYARQQRHQMGKWQAGSKQERSPSHYHRPGMGSKDHLERQWHPTRCLAEEGRVTTPVSRRWVESYTARYGKAMVHMSQPKWHGNVATGQHEKELERTDKKGTEEEKTVMIGSMPCKLPSEIHVNGQ
jgi:hypothetical protein